MSNLVISHVSQTEDILPALRPHLTCAWVVGKYLGRGKHDRRYNGRLMQLKGGGFILTTDWETFGILPGEDGDGDAGLALAAFDMGEATNVQWSGLVKFVNARMKPTA